MGHQFWTHQANLAQVHSARPDVRSLGWRVLSRDSFWDCCGRHRHTGSPRWHQRMFTWPHAHQAVHAAPASQTPAVPANTIQNAVTPSPLLACSLSTSSIMWHFYTVSFLFIPAEDGLSWGSKEHLTWSTGVFSNPPASRQHFFPTEMRRDQSPKLPLGAGPTPPLWCDTTNVVEKQTEGLSEDTLTFLYGKALVTKVGLKKKSVPWHELRCLTSSRISVVGSRMLLYLPLLREPELICPKGSFLIILVASSFKTKKF